MCGFRSARNVKNSSPLICYHSRKQPISQGVLHQENKNRSRVPYPQIPVHERFSMASGGVSSVLANIICFHKHQIANGRYHCKPGKVTSALTNNQCQYLLPSSPLDDVDTLCTYKLAGGAGRLHQEPHCARQGHLVAFIVRTMYCRTKGAAGCSMENYINILCASYLGLKSPQIIQTEQWSTIHLRRLALYLNYGESRNSPAEICTDHQVPRSNAMVARMHSAYIRNNKKTLGGSWTAYGAPRYGCFSPLLRTKYPV